MTQSYIMYGMNFSLTEKLLATAVTAARRAGEVILGNMGQLGKEDVESKQAFDFVTSVDRWSESVIIRTVREQFPHHSFFAEETLKQEGTGEYRWIIDPLDGTTNFIHGYPVFSVSVALEYRGEMVIGVVLDPLRDELFHAVRGKGAFLNSSRISVSCIAEMDKGLVATGFPFRKKEMISRYLEAFREIFERVSDIRRAGSAAIDLAYVAAGRCDGFFELNLSPWDVAAGAVLIEEAGGSISDFSGGREYLNSGNIVAGNRYVQSELLQIIKGVFGGIITR